jgi:hypothetical protein
MITDKWKDNVRTIERRSGRSGKSILGILTLYSAHDLKFLELGYRPVHTALDSPFVHEQPFDCPDVVLPFIRNHAPERKMILFDQAVRRLVLHTLDPLQPPGQTDDALCQYGFHHADGPQLIEQRLAMKLECGRVFTLYHGFTSKKPVLDRILRDNPLTLLRPRPGGFLCIKTIRLDLSFCSHSFSPFCLLSSAFHYSGAQEARLYIWSNMHELNEILHK